MALVRWGRSADFWPRSGRHEAGLSQRTSACQGAKNGN